MWQGIDSTSMVKPVQDLINVTASHLTNYVKTFGDPKVVVEDGVMSMFHVEDGYELPAGGSVELAPGGKHVMFIGLYEKLEVGQVVTVELEFEKSGTRTVEVEIKEE